jgi:hypothetical protein
MSDPTGLRNTLLGVLGGLILGAAAGLAIGRIPEPVRAAPVAVVGPAPRALGATSFAQQGEDLVVAEILYDQFHVRTPTYIDIGAHDPIENNNTYFLYRTGGRGVLVEPNPFYAEKLRAARPGDQVLQAGIGPSLEDTLQGAS